MYKRQILQRPVLGSGVTTGYVLVLLLAFLVLPVSSALFLAFSFSAFAAFGRLALQEGVDSDEEEDEGDFDDGSQVNLLALGAAIVTTGVLNPLSSQHSVAVAPLSAIDGRFIFAIGASIAFFGIWGMRRKDDPTRKLPTEYDLMNSWDEKLQDSDEQRKRK